jgi:beta-xylosidase
MTTSPNSDLSETSSAPALLSSDKSAWQDPEADSAARLVSLPEKLAQLGSVWLGFDVVTGDVAPMQNVFSRNASWPEAVADGIGHLTRVFGTKPVRLPTACDGFGTCSGRWWNRHGWASPGHRPRECLTGFTTFQATVYPTALAWAATFDPGLVYEMASVIGRDVAASTRVFPQYSMWFGTTAGTGRGRIHQDDPQGTSH